MVERANKAVTCPHAVRYCCKLNRKGTVHFSLQGEVAYAVTGPHAVRHGRKLDRNEMARVLLQRLYLCQH